MGFKSIDHRFGATLFGVLLILGVIGMMQTSGAEYRMAYIGSFLWILGKFAYEKNPFDLSHKQFDYLRYLDAEWDNLAVNLVGIYVFVPQMHNIAGLQTKIEYSDLWYYGAGILSDGLYILIVLLAKLKKKYESAPLKDEETNIN